MAALVVLLAVACLASFAFAYYLFTTRWSPTNPHEPPADQNIQVIQANTFQVSPREYTLQKVYLIVPTAVCITSGSH